MPKTLNSKDAPINASLNPMLLLKGLFLSIVISLILMLIFAFICKTFIPADNYILLSSDIICLLGTFFYGFYLSKHISKGGLLNGCMSGFIYFLLIFIISSVLLKSFNFPKAALTMLIISLLGGSIGGTVGINTSKSYRRR